MKILKPRIEISLDLIDLDEDQANEIDRLVEGMQLKVESVSGNVAKIVYFTSLDEYENFLMELKHVR